MHGFHRILITALACATFVPAWAQLSPGKPIRIIVPYPAGGSADVTTRVAVNRMLQELGQPVIVENRPGANANIGAEAVAGSAPDGHTLLASAPFLIINPLHETGLRWQAEDFVPVARLGQMQNMIVVPANLPVASLADFVTRAKAAPGLPVGTAGTGNSQTNAILMLEAVAGVQFTHVYYKGGPPIVPDLMSGVLAMSVLPYSLALPGLKDGRLKALANLSKQRSVLLPELPTSSEAGYPAVIAVSWYGLHAPKGTPRASIQKLESAVLAALQSADIKALMLKTGGEPAALGAEGFERFLREETQLWGPFLRAARLKAGN